MQPAKNVCDAFGYQISTNRDERLLIAGLRLCRITLGHEGGRSREPRSQDDTLGRREEGRLIDVCSRRFIEPFPSP